MECLPRAGRYPGRWAHVVTTAGRGSGPRHLWENGDHLTGLCTCLRDSGRGERKGSQMGVSPAVQPGPYPGQGQPSPSGAGGLQRTRPSVSVSKSESPLSLDRKVTLLVGPDKLRIAWEAEHSAAPATPMRSRSETTLPPKGRPAAASIFGTWLSPASCWGGGELPIPKALSLHLAAVLEVPPGAGQGV